MVGPVGGSCDHEAMRTMTALRNLGWLTETERRLLLGGALPLPTILKLRTAAKTPAEILEEDVERLQAGL